MTAVEFYDRTPIENIISSLTTVPDKIIFIGDGKLHDISDEEKDTENEMDAILMKGMIPVFISCKNGQVDDDELYEDSFGGRSSSIE